MANECYRTVEFLLECGDLPYSSHFVKINQGKTKLTNEQKKQILTTVIYNSTKKVDERKPLVLS